MAIVFSLGMQGGEPAEKIKSSPLRGRVIFNLKGGYYNPVFTPDGMGLIVAKTVKYETANPEDGKQQENEVDEIWHVNLANGKLTPVITVADYKGHITDQALLDQALLESPGHLRLGFKDAEIGRLRFSLDLKTFIARRLNDSSEDDGHDELIRTPDEESAFPVMAGCFPKKDSSESEDDDWLLYVFPKTAAYVQRTDERWNYEPVIWRCDLRSRMRIKTLSRSADWHGTLEGGVRNGYRVMLGFRSNGQLELFSGDVRTPVLKPAGMITGNGNYFDMDPTPNNPAFVVIATRNELKQTESNLYYFDGRAMIKFTDLPLVIGADVSSDGRQLAITQEDGEHDQITVYRLLGH